MIIERGRATSSVVRAQRERSVQMDPHKSFLVVRMQKRNSREPVSLSLSALPRSWGIHGRVTGQTPKRTILRTSCPKPCYPADCKNGILYGIRFRFLSDKEVCLINTTFGFDHAIVVEVLNCTDNQKIKRNIQSQFHLNQPKG